MDRRWISTAVDYVATQHMDEELGGGWWVSWGWGGGGGAGRAGRGREGGGTGVGGKRLPRARHELRLRLRDAGGIGFPELRRRDVEILRDRRGPIGGHPHGIV